MDELALFAGAMNREGWGRLAYEEFRLSMPEELPPWDGLNKEAQNAFCHSAGVVAARSALEMRNRVYKAIR